MFFYHFAWMIIVLSFLPLVPILRSRRFIERAGLSLPEDRPERGSIWIHALSVGEVLSAIPLVKSLNQKYPEKGIVFTVATPQGMEIARNELEKDVTALLTMPLDFWWSIRRIVNYIRPSFFILIETDVWPGLISHLRNRGIKTILVNGRISPRTFASYKKFSYATRFMLNLIELFMMQSDLDRGRLLKIGIGPDKVRTVGNIKFDRTWLSMNEEEHKQWLDTLDLGHEDEVWVAGSTHQGEERIILEVFGRLRSIFSNLRLIIAPRRVERSEDIKSFFLNRGFKAILKTEIPVNGRPYDVLILNTLGELGRIYGIAEICFVGGSLIPIGGHNLLEPASLGRPVLFGPHTHNFVLMSRLLVEARGGQMVKDGEELFRAMKGLLSDPEKYKKMGRQAKEFVEMNKGALERVMGYIDGYIESK